MILTYIVLWTLLQVAREASRTDECKGGMQKCSYAVYNKDTSQISMLNTLHSTQYTHIQSQLLLPDIGHLSGKYHAWPTIMKPA